MANLPIKDGNGSTVNLLAPGERTTQFMRVINSGAIPAGALSVTFANTGDNTGTVLGTALKRGEDVDFDAPTGDTLQAIDYNASGTEFTIVVVRV